MTAPPAGEDFTRRLATLLARRVDGFRALLGIERLSAGASRETYRVDIQTAGGPMRLALRRSGGEGASLLGVGPGLAAEAELIQAARAAGAPGPEVVCGLAPEDGLGAGFLTSWIDAETLGARIARSPAFAAVRPRLVRQCGETLARIHSIDPALLCLRARLRTLTPLEAVRTTAAAYHQMGSFRPVIDFAARWLEAHLPPEAPLALCHGDFRTGNLMVDPDRGLTAVLDWELAHIGDPLRDLGWLCTRSWRFGGEGEAGGFGDVDDLVAAYEAAGGRGVDRRALGFWEVFGSFWWAVGCLGMGRSFRDGLDRGVERPAIGRRSSECEIDLVNLLIPGPVPPLAEAPVRSLSGADLPVSAELLEGVREHLKESAGVSEGRAAFMGRVAVNAVDIVLREFALGPAAEAAAAAAYGAFLGRTGTAPDLRRDVCARLRAGACDLADPLLAHALRVDAAGQARIDQPRYPGVIEALSRT